MRYNNYNDNLSGPQLRTRLVQYISDEEYLYDRFTNFYIDDCFQTYLEELNGTAWADEFAITATAEMLIIKINKLEDAGNWIPINDKETVRREIKIGHISELHYVALENIENFDSQNSIKTFTEIMEVEE